MDFGILSDHENRALPCAALKFSLFGRAPKKSPKSIPFGTPFCKVLGIECGTIPSQGGHRAPRGRQVCPPFFAPLPGDPKTREKTPQKGPLPEGPSSKLDPVLPPHPPSLPLKGTPIDLKLLAFASVLRNSLALHLSLKRTHLNTPPAACIRKRFPEL